MQANLFIQNDPYPHEENSISQTVGMQEPYFPTIVQGYTLEILHIFSLKYNRVWLSSCIMPA